MATLGEPLPQTASSVCFDVETGGHDDGLSAFLSVRQRLFGIAYQMLGSVTQAEDIVQDVWLRWHSTNQGAVENAPAFLATTTARLCINLAQSARFRRETSIGDWLREPENNSGDPEMLAERGEALSVAARVLFEKLPPTERAAYVLREAFDYSYREVANVLQMEEANSRQLVSRARKHIADGRRILAASGEKRRFLKTFIDATQNGDMSTLEELFIENAVFHSADDGFLHGPCARFWLEEPGGTEQDLLS